MLRNLIKPASVQRYKQNIIYGCRKLHMTLQHTVEEKPQKMEKQHDKLNAFLTKYTMEQEEQILKIVNNYTLSELLGFEISKGSANKLLAWRMRNGLLKDLSDIFAIEGFGPKNADKLFQSLLRGPKINELNSGKVQTKTSSFVLPSLEPDHRKAIKSCVSVRIGVNSITWSRLDVPGQDVNAPCMLTHWQHHEISEKKLHLNELIQRCLYIYHCIPNADCYLFENPQTAQVSNNPSSAEQQNINIQKAQVTAIMGYALASRNSHLSLVIDSEKDKSNYFPNIFYVRRFLTARLFNHLVGTERVSSEEKILDMMRTFYNTNENQENLISQPEQELGDVKQLHKDNVNFAGHVQFPMELREMFSNAPRYYREFLGQTLLLNLTFVRLVLLQDSKSIATVSSAKKAKTI